MNHETQGIDTVWPARMRRAQASQYLFNVHGVKLCPQSLARLACKGGGPCYKTLNGRWVLYERADLDLWVSEHLSPARAHSAAHQVAKEAKAKKG